MSNSKKLSGYRYHDGDFKIEVAVSLNGISIDEATSNTILTLFVVQTCLQPEMFSTPCGA